jgi:hypothetical protein
VASSLTTAAAKSLVNGGTAADMGHGRGRITNVNQCMWNCTLVQLTEKWKQLVNPVSLDDAWVPLGCQMRVDRGSQVFSYFSAGTSMVSLFDMYGQTGDVSNPYFRIFWIMVSDERVSWRLMSDAERPSQRDDHGGLPSGDSFVKLSLNQRTGRS